MYKNVAGQKVGCQLTAKADGTDVTTGTTTVYVTVDAGTQATGSVGSGACVHEGNGYWTYAPAQAETNGDLIAFTFVNTAAISSTMQVYTTSLFNLGILTTGTAQSATSTTIVLASATNFTTDSILVGSTVVITGGTGVGQSRVINAYSNSSDTATVDAAWITNPDNTSTYVVFAGPPAATAAPDVNVSTINSQAVSATGGITFPSGTLASTTNVTAGTVTTVSGNVSGNVVGSVASVTAPVTLTSAYDFAKGTVAMTESYAADGAPMTPAQALYMLWSLFAERNISGVTLTTKKLDGSTTAMAFTLNSAVTPTGQTRSS